MNPDMNNLLLAITALPGALDRLTAAVTAIAAAGAGNGEVVFDSAANTPAADEPAAAPAAKKAAKKAATPPAAATVTVEDVKKVMQVVIEQHKKTAEARECFTKVGAKKLGDVKPEKLGELKGLLEALIPAAAENEDEDMFA